MGPSNDLLAEDVVFTGFATAQRAELEIATAAAGLTVVKMDGCSCALLPIQVQLKYIMPAYRAATSFPKSILLNCSNQAFCLTPCWSENDSGTYASKSGSIRAAPIALSGISMTRITRV